MEPGAGGWVVRPRKLGRSRFREEEVVHMMTVLAASSAVSTE